VKITVMKKIMGVLVIIVIIMIGASGCKKSNAVVPINTISHWKLDGKSDTGAVTLYSTQTNYMESNQYISDTITKVLIIGFSTKPTASGKFEVVGQNTTVNSKECIIEAATITPTQVMTGVKSTGQPGDSVTVTIVNGKIYASFSNIVILENGGFYSLISGELIEQ
jgi:hypothetical protein